MLKIKFSDEAKRFFISDAFQSTSWFESLSFCKSMGMDLFSPENFTVNQQVIEILQNEGHNSTIAIGATRIGTESFWYSSKTGVEVDVKVVNDGKLCLHLVNSSGDYEFKSVSCIDPTEEFLCESTD